MPEGIPLLLGDNGAQGVSFIYPGAHAPCLSPYHYAVVMAFDEVLLVPRAEAVHHVFVSPRSRGKSLVLNHAEPSYFARHMKEAIKRIENKPLDHRLAFVKSWNEWAEGNYLEPDLHYGKRYLEVIKKNVVEG